MEAIILAGGFGTRLREAVPDLPKPLAPVAGRPFLSILMEHLVNSGVTHIVLSVGYLHEKIIAAYGNAFQGARISYAIEQEPLGTGGALRQSLDLCTDTTVLALNGDSFAEFDFARLVALGAEHRCAMGLMIVEDTSRYGRVDIEGNRVCGFQEKGVGGAGYINAGVYALTRDFLSGALPAKFSFETDFLVPNVRNLDIGCLIGSGLFIDIGVPEDYARAQILFARP